MRMVMKQNPLTGDWLCMIPEVPGQAYIVKRKKNAKLFVNKINKAIDKKEIELKDGKIKINKT